MWSVGLNKSKITVQSRRDSSIDSNGSSGNNVLKTSPHRMRNKRLCEHEEEEGVVMVTLGEKEKEKFEIKPRRSMSKSSVEDLSRRRSVREKEIWKKSRQQQRVTEGDYSKVPSGMRLCQSQQQKESSSPTGSPPRPFPTLTSCISTQTDSFYLFPTVISLDSNQQHQVQNHLQKMNSLYELKIAELQIQFANFRMGVEKEMGKMRQEIGCVVERVMMEVGVGMEKMKKKIGTKQERVEKEGRDKGSALEAEQRIRNILTDVEELKAVFNVNGKINGVSKLLKMKQKQGRILT